MFPRKKISTCISDKATLPLPRAFAPYCHNLPRWRLTAQTCSSQQRNPAWLAGGKNNLQAMDFHCSAPQWDFGHLLMQAQVEGSR